MKNLKSLSSDELVSKTKDIVKDELRIGLEVLEYLREIERRKLYLDRGHSSLFSFCIQELGYSEPQAQFRIDAMRALRDTPEIEEKVRSGELNVSSIVKVQRFLRKERIRTGQATRQEAKLDLFQKVAGKTNREVERELIKISPESALPKERERILSGTKTELRLVISEELRSELKALQSLYSHRMKDPNSFAELLELLAHDAVKRSDRDFQQHDDKYKEKSVKADQNVAPIALKVNLGNLSSPSRSRYIPASIKRHVWSRDRGQCSFVDPKTGQKCRSTHYLQIDHVTPYAFRGPSDDPANLRLLCGSHNRHAWERLSGAYELRSLEADRPG